MSLTDDWKAKKIDTSQRYWIVEKGIPSPTLRLMNERGKFIDGFGYPISRKMIKEVLAPCSYDHFVELTEKVKTLTSENKHLSDLLANQDNEVERLREENATLNKVFETDFDVLVCDVTNVKQKDQIIEQLHQLLEDCKPYIQKEMEIIKGAGFCNCDWAWKTSDVLTRINAAINESK